MYATTTILNLLWKKCIIEHGLTVQLRPTDDMKLLTTRLRRRHTALKREHGASQLGQALALYCVKPNLESRQLVLTFVDVEQDTLRYLVNELRLEDIRNSDNMRDLHITMSSDAGGVHRVVPLATFTHHTPTL